MEGLKAKASESRREWAHRVGMCGLLAALTAIITVLFSYVGALCLAVIVGMMAGTTPGSLGWALRVSFVFPVVMVAMLQMWGVELAFVRQLMMGGLSFVMFWVVYGVTALVVSLEAKPLPPDSAPAAGGAALAADAAVNGQLHDQDHERLNPFTLRAMAGEWRCEDLDVRGLTLRKTLRIEGDRFSLAIDSLNGDGPATLTGHLELADPRSDQRAALVFIADQRKSQDSNSANLHITQHQV